MIRIRLARGGAKNKPFYRIVAIEKHRKRGGKPLDRLVYHNPINKELKIDHDTLKFWQDKGAEVSSAVKRLLEEK